MLILILIDTQYLQNVDFSFDNGLNGRNHSSSGSHHPIKKFSPRWGYPTTTPQHYLENPVEGKCLM